MLNPQSSRCYWFIWVGSRQFTEKVKERGARPPARRACSCMYVVPAVRATRDPPTDTDGADGPHNTPGGGGAITGGSASRQVNRRRSGAFFWYAVLHSARRRL